jgi:hypothetical protein
MPTSVVVRYLEHSLNASCLECPPNAPRLAAFAISWSDKKAHAFLLSVYRYTVVSRAGEIRAGASAAPGDGFHSGQHRRGLREAKSAREGWLPEYRRGFRGGAPLLFDPVPQDLGYGQSESLMSALEETSQLLMPMLGRSWLLAPDLRASISYRA